MKFPKFIGKTSFGVPAKEPGKIIRHLHCCILESWVPDYNSNRFDKDLQGKLPRIVFHIHAGVVLKLITTEWPSVAFIKTCIVLSR